MSKKSISIFWFRRDLRLDDNTGLYHALKSDFPVIPLFIFDTTILNNLENKKDQRVEFIHHTLEDINKELKKYNTTILVHHGKPIDVWKSILKKYNVKAIYINTDYEPYAIQRDAEIKKLAEKNKISFYSLKDQTIFEKNEILKDDHTPYTIFTPYSKKWKKNIVSSSFSSYPTKKHFSNFYKIKSIPILSLKKIGFLPTPISFPSKKIKNDLVKNYHRTRDYPSMAGTSRLSVHLRFGTISIRKLAKHASQLNETFLNELIWRDFYMMILYHFPQVVNKSFKPKYDFIPWRNNDNEFKKWCEGKTGYPLVDAGMRELNETGFMHNRIRMLTASFLTKHLLIDWRWGEAYFAEKLLDYDLAANNGGWQWAAGSGCDAAPYFRIFNPTTQMKKFDAKMKYIKKWVPEFFTNPSAYPDPIVDHDFARKRAIATYQQALKKK